MQGWHGGVHCLCDTCTGCVAGLGNVGEGGKGRGTTPILGEGGTGRGTTPVPGGGGSRIVQVVLQWEGTPERLHNWYHRERWHRVMCKLYCGVVEVGAHNLYVMGGDGGVYIACSLGR